MIYTHKNKNKNASLGEIYGEIYMCSLMAQIGDIITPVTESHPSYNIYEEITRSNIYLNLTKLNRDTYHNISKRVIKVDIYFYNNSLKIKASDGFYIYNRPDALCNAGIIYIKNRNIYKIPLKYNQQIEDCLKNRLSMKDTFNIISL